MDRSAIDRSEQLSTSVWPRREEEEEEEEEGGGGGKKKRGKTWKLVFLRSDDSDRFGRTKKSGIRRASRRGRPRLKCHERYWRDKGCNGCSDRTGQDDPRSRTREQCHVGSRGTSLQLLARGMWADRKGHSLRGKRALLSLSLSLSRSRELTISPLIDFTRPLDSRRETRSNAKSRIRSYRRSDVARST